nr:hypothetical protein BaRGS_031353 [Batillaria attramentaria]
MARGAFEILRSYSNMAAKGKKLINTVDTCVDDNLEGYVALNPGVRLLKGHRVVIRADFEEVQNSGKVAVVVGGGSGHEPAFSGYVGKGMLTAAVMGSVFACPPSSEVLVALRAIGKHNPAGCFFVIPNYTGDRLNFGLATERAQGEGIRMATVTVGEDCALTTSDKSAGRRGITGIVVACKIAGALAEDGRSLEDIASIVSNAVSNMGDRVAVFINDMGGISQLELNIIAKESIVYLARVKDRQ